MATYKNLRYCEILHEGTYYDVMIAVNNLDEVDDVLQEWALANTDIAEALTLPQELILNQDITETLTSKDIDNFVYEKSAVSAYMDGARSAGISGTLPTLPKILVGGLYVVPTCTAFLWSTATFSGVFGESTIAQASFTLVSGQVNYIGITYNSGAPAYALYTDATSFNYSSIIPVCAILYFDTELNVIPIGQAGYGLPEKLMLNQYYRKEFDIVTDFTLEDDTLHVEIGALTVNNGTALIDCLAFNSATASNDLWLYYKDGLGAWQTSQSDTINNTQYQGAGLQVLAGGKYVINYIYRAIDDANLLAFNILSGSFDTLAAAKESDMITDLPDAIKEGAVLVGRMIVVQGSSTPTVQKIQRVNSFGTVA